MHRRQQGHAPAHRSSGGSRDVRELDTDRPLHSDARGYPRPGIDLRVFSTGVPDSGSRIVEHMRRLEPDETAMSARQWKGLGAAIDRLASYDVLQSYPLVPAVPLFVAAERTGHSGVPALEEAEDVFRWNSFLDGRALGVDFPASYRRSPSWPSFGSTTRVLRRLASPRACSRAPREACPPPGQPAERAAP